MKVASDVLGDLKTAYVDKQITMAKSRLSTINARNSN